MGLLKEEVGTTASGNEVIYYSLTKSGKKLLDFGIKSGYLSKEILDVVEAVSSKY